MGSRILSCCVLLAAFLGSPIFLTHAQVNTASIRGTVTDSTGAVVADASVNASNNATGAKATTLTNAQGIYSFPVLNVGAYTVSAELRGFKTAVRQGVELQVNQTARIDLVLEGGAGTERGVGEDRVPLVEAETSSLGRVVPQRDEIGRASCRER